MLENGLYYVDYDYAKIPGKLTRLIKYPQSPIRADELEFTTPISTPVPELSEIVFVDCGEHIFHGLALKREDAGNSWKINCKSMQWLLDYRYIPYFNYHNVTLNEVLSSDASAAGAATVGALFWVNSLVPNGLWEAYSSTVAKLPNAGLKSALQDRALYACTAYPNAGSIDACDGIKILSNSGSLPPGANQYYRDVNDLYVRLGDGSYLPNAFLVAAADWADTKIRRGTISLGSYKSSLDFDLHGKAAKSLDDFREKCGLECQILPYKDGYLYMNWAEEISRGSASSPVRKFVDGEHNVRIYVADKKEPDVQAAIGVDSSNLNFATQLSADWSFRGPQIFKIYDGMGAGKEDLTTKLEGIIADNEVSYDIYTPDIDHHLRVGDWVSIYRKDIGELALRIQKYDYNNGITKISVGKKIFSASKAFGEYLRAAISSNQSPRKITVIPGGSGSFVVNSSYISEGSWKCFYEETFSPPSDDSNVAIGGFLTLKIQGKVVPPGRILLADESMVRIDITDFCSTSPSSNTTNTVLRTLNIADGWTSDGCYVKQYKAQQIVVA